MTTLSAPMAKQRDGTVKISNDLWQKLKLIHAVTGEKMNEYVARVLGPQLAKDHKKALDLLARRQGGDE